MSALLVLATATAQATDGFDDYVSSIAIQADGKIVVGGQFANVGGLRRARLARLLTDGRVDAAFVPALPAQSRVDTLAILPDGRILAGGFFPDASAPTGSGGYTLLALNPDGSASTLPSEPDGSPSTLLVESNGEVVVGGGSIDYMDNYPRQHIARLNADLTLDGGFEPDAPTYSNIYSLSEQPNGKLLISGNFMTMADAAHQITANSVARLNADGTVDASFLLPIEYHKATPPGYDVRKVSALPNGKILTGGYYDLAGLGLVTMSLHNADGSLDSADFTPAIYGAPNTFAVQTDGRIVLGGVFSQIGNSSDNLVRNNIGRLNADGSPDPTFMAGTNPDASGNVTAIVVQSDGKVLIGGSFTQVNGQVRNRIARLLSGGVLDPGFSVNDRIFANGFQ